MSELDRQWNKIAMFGSDAWVMEINGFLWEGIWWAEVTECADGDTVNVFGFISRFDASNHIVPEGRVLLHMR